MLIIKNNIPLLIRELAKKRNVTVCPFRVTFDCSLNGVFNRKCHIALFAH